MPQYFFYLAGFGGNLPRAELHSLLRRAHYKVTVVLSVGRLEICEISPLFDFDVLRLSAFKILAGVNLYHSRENPLGESALDSVVETVNWAGLAGETTEKQWSVRVKGDRKYYASGDLKRAEQYLAGKIYDLWPYPVKLKLADVQFQLIAAQNDAGATAGTFGILKYKQPIDVKRNLSRTLALRRPFFSIGTMNNPIARVVANLSETPPGTIILDPFCGSGGILIEAALNGSYCLGIDVNWLVLRGARQNLRYFAPDMRLGEVRASALALPIRPNLARAGNAIQGASTDFPYGRSSSTHGLTVNAIWEGFLHELLKVLARGAKCCLVVPKSDVVEKIIEKFRAGAAFSIVETCTQEVHDSLTRLFVVLQYQDAFTA